MDIDTILLLAILALLAYEVLKPKPQPSFTQQLVGAAPAIAAIFA